MGGILSEYVLTYIGITFIILSSHWTEYYSSQLSKCAFDCVLKQGIVLDSGRMKNHVILLRSVTNLVHENLTGQYRLSLVIAHVYQTGI